MSFDPRWQSAFLEAACVPLNAGHASGTLEEAEALRAANPDAASVSIYAAAVLGDADRVQQFLELDPDLATAPGGPRRWDALTHLCFSRYLRLDPSRSDGFLKAAAVLLDAGADPNSGWREEAHEPTATWESVLYGAAGVARNAGVTGLLLASGADPNDDETPYHVPESYDNTVLKLLVESGRLTADSLATLLLRKADWHDRDGIAYLLEHGADPNRLTGWHKTALQQSVQRGNASAIVELMLEHGADPTLSAQNPSAVVLAARAGRGDLLALFESRSFPLELEGPDRLLAAAARGNRQELLDLADAAQQDAEELRRDGGRALAQFAGSGNTSGCACLLDLGVPVDALFREGDGYFGIAGNGTALHVAAWRARHETVRLLIERGASVNALDGRGRSALALAALACVASHWTDRRSPDSVRALVSAGARVAGTAFPCGYAEVDELLRPQVAAKLRRMSRPRELWRRGPVEWGPGLGAEVWELFCACIVGNVEAVRRLVRRDPSLLRAQHCYRGPLYFAVRENQVEVARFLLERAAWPSSGTDESLLEMAEVRGYREMRSLLERMLESRYGISARGEEIAAAIRARETERVKALLDARSELLHAGDLRGNQPIHWAVMTRQLGLVDALLERGASLESQRWDGARPLQLFNGDYHFRGRRDVPADHPTTPEDVIEHLLARGAEYDLCTAAHRGDLPRVRELLDRDPGAANRVSDYITYYAGSGSPLRNAALGGHLEVVRLLLERGADPNQREEGIAPRGAALYEAAARGHHAVVELLLEQGADPNPNMESSADALSRALSRDDPRMVELLCSHGASRSLELLAYYGDVRTAAALLHANTGLAEDPVALAYAAEEGHEPFLRLLLRRQPDLASRVGVAARTCELTELLFTHGMDPSFRDWQGVTPLHRLARAGKLEQAALFLDRGADLHARDEELCSTPLGWAARAGQGEMVRLLLRRGAPREHPEDPPWATALAWATRRGHRAVIDLLLSGTDA
jgi:ankyrin repeat protein